MRESPFPGEVQPGSLLSCQPKGSARAGTAVAGDIRVSQALLRVYHSADQVQSRRRLPGALITVRRSQPISDQKTSPSPLVPGEIKESMGALGKLPEPSFPSSSNGDGRVCTATWHAPIKKPKATVSAFPVSLALISQPYLCKGPNTALCARVSNCRSAQASVCKHEPWPPH